jgi:hypothetical protein
VIGIILALPWYMWLSFAGNVIGVFIFVQNPLAILGALAGSPFNTDVSGLRNAISSDTVQPGTNPALPITFLPWFLLLSAPVESCLPGVKLRCLLRSSSCLR